MGLSSESISKELITFEMQENNPKLMLKVAELSNKLRKMEEINIELKCYEVEVAYLKRRLCDAEQSRRADEDLLTMSQKQKDRFKQLYLDAMKYMRKEPIKEWDCVNSINHSETTTLHITSTDGKDKKLMEAEQKLQERNKELNNLKEEYNEYRKENSINFNILNEQHDTMERKLREHHSVELKSQANFASEKIKSQQKDIIIYKEQIQTLEDRNQMYDKINQKHEAAITSLRDEILSNIQNLSTAQNHCKYLERELRQSDFEGRVQMTKQEEDQVKFEEKEKKLKLEKEDAVNKMMDEHKQNERLRSKLEQAEVQVKDLNDKLHQTLTPCETDVSIVKRNKDLELQVINKAAEIQQLRLELKEKVTRMNEDNERLKTDLKASQLSETNLKSHIEELQEEIRSLQVNVPGAESENHVQMELNASLQKITKKDKELLELETECHKLKKYLLFVQSTQDLKLSKCQEENHQLRSAKDEAVKKLTSSRLEWEAKSKELKDKVEKLEKQNMKLMKPVQEISPIPNDSTTNSSLIEEGFKEYSSEKLSSREKDIEIASIENLSKENIRLSTELAVQKKQIDQLSDVKLQGFNVIPKTEYEELLLNLKTLNAITDNNIHLRSEKNRLEGEIASNIERLQESADEQKKLQNRLDSLKQENAKLTLDLIDTKKPISMKDNKLKANLNKGDEMKIIEMEPSSIGSKLKELPSTTHPNLVKFNRGVHTPIASIKPISSQNVQANGTTSTAEALFSSPTISAIVSAPSLLVSDGLSSVQSVPQHEASPLQNTLFTSEQGDDENAAASTPSSSLVFQKTMSSHQNDSLSNEARTSQAGTKRPRDAEGDSQTNMEESSEAVSSSHPVTATLRTKKRQTVDASMVQNVEDITDNDESAHGESEGLASNNRVFDSLKSAKKHNGCTGNKKRGRPRHIASNDRTRKPEKSISHGRGRPRKAL